MNLFGYHEEYNIFDRGGFDMDGFEDFADSSVQESTGRWTREEHLAFVKGLELYGKGWKKIASLIKTRTVVQIRTHAQKYFLKLTKSRYLIIYNFHISFLIFSYFIIDKTLNQQESLSMASP